MYNILTLNSIADRIWDILSEDNFKNTKDENEANGIIVRSQEMNGMSFSKNLYAIARAGAGVNNIPVGECADKGIVVFNTPGANANAVREMVICSFIMAARNVLESIEWTKTLKNNGSAVPAMAEKGKKNFVGNELKGKTLGLIGLGAVGSLVADAALALGMNVVGNDPHLTVNSALGLSKQVKIVTEDELIRISDIISIHAPLTDETKNKFNKQFIDKTKQGVILANMSRAAIANSDDIIEGLKNGHVKKYIIDFPTDELIGVEGVIMMPHLASGTYESEDNCAEMAAEEMKDFLENGNITNSVNYPACNMGTCETKTRITICHKNKPSLIQKMSSILSDAGVNIENMMNKSKGEYAYTLIDTNVEINSEIINNMEKIEDVIKVREIKGNA